MLNESETVSYVWIKFNKPAPAREPMQLKGSKTEGNLKAAFAGESQANRRYLYFAAKADVEGYNDVAAVFRSTAEGETGQAHGHMDIWKPAAFRQQDFPSALPATI